MEFEKAKEFQLWLYENYGIAAAFHRTKGKGDVEEINYVYGIRWNKDPKYTDYPIKNEITSEQQKEILNKIKELFGEDYDEMGTIMDGCPESIYYVNLRKKPCVKMETWVDSLGLNLNLKKDN